MYYFALRDRLHIEGYYNGSLSFEEVRSYLEDLDLFIQKLKKSNSNLIASLNTEGKCDRV